MIKKPFIKKFRTDNNFYIYDVNTNKFFKTDEAVYLLLDDDDNSHESKSERLAVIPHDQLKFAENNIAKMKKAGIFSDHMPLITYFHKMERHEFLKAQKEILENKLKRVTLHITEKCNLRCRYCVYSKNYIYNRRHSSKHMTADVMKRAVDFYFMHNQSVDEKNISFFGGEPLANYSVLKECVEYTKSKHSPITEFNMTINGTLLSDDKFDFLVKHNFSLLISLDGPQNIHDRYRVFRNGKGSFAAIQKNLRALKKKYPEYYKKKIRFNVVLAPPVDFEIINHFLESTDILPAAVKFSYLNTHHTTFYNQFSDLQLQEDRTKRTENLQSFNRKIAAGVPLNQIEESMFKIRYHDIHTRKVFPLPDKYPSHGQCMLGERVLHVNTQGHFNFCTRVEDVFNLGNIYEGYDYKCIEKVYMDMEDLLSKKCFGCWAIRFCHKCINDVNENGVVNEKTFNKSCASNKRIIIKEIEDYIKIREENPNALDYLNEIQLV